MADHVSVAMPPTFLQPSPPAPVTSATTNVLSASDFSTLGTAGASATASDSSRYFREFFTGRRLDKRLLVYFVALGFTAVVMAFSMVMIVLRQEETNVWLPVMTFVLGIWVSELRQLHGPSKTDAAPASSPQSVYTAPQLS